jgi:hypothetical protein
MIVNPNPFGSLSQIKLSEFEKKNKLHLPDDYREFLLLYNGGQPKPSFFWIEPKIDGSCVNLLYGLHDDPTHYSIDTYAGSERYGIPDTMLPIGEDGVGNYICLGISSNNYSIIYFLDHDEHPFNEPNSLDGITQLSNTFTEFLSSLTESPD